VLPATRQRWESRLYPQSKQVLDLATPEGCKAELPYVRWKRTGWDLNPRPVSRKSNALPQRHHATLETISKVTNADNKKRMLSIGLVLDNFLDIASHNSEVEEFSTHNSATTNAGHCLVTLTFDHFYIKLGDPSCIDFEISCGKRQTGRQTDKQTQTPLNSLPTQPPSASVR